MTERNPMWAPIALPPAPAKPAPAKPAPRTTLPLDLRRTPPQLHAQRPVVSGRYSLALTSVLPPARWVR
jgi:hypothetical protein